MNPAVSAEVLLFSRRVAEKGKPPPAELSGTQEIKQEEA